MTFESWVLLIGCLLLLTGLGAAYVRRLPFTTTMIYLGLGVVVGPAGWAVLHVHPLDRATLFLRAAEVTVVISLFTVGLKLRLPWRDRRWVAPLFLAFGSMVITVALIAVAGMWWLGLSLGAAVLLGGILAPTDPVLASEVQLEHPADRDSLRLALSGEAGFNDGTAFPFVMLGLGLLGLHELGAGGWRWWVIDVGWAIFGGFAIGGALGYAAGRCIVYLRRGQRPAATLDEYLLLGLIGLAYGSAVKLHAYGFLAVFAAGIALRSVELKSGGGEPAELEKINADVGPSAAQGDPKKGPAYLAKSFLAFNEQLERIAEVGMVLLVGAALGAVGFRQEGVWFAVVLFCVIRPLSVLPLARSRSLTRGQWLGIAWFGVRGIGSIYYLMYAVEAGLPTELAEQLTRLTFTVVAASIVAHGITVTPLLRVIRRSSRQRPA